MLDGQTQLTAMFGAPERLSKELRPAPAPVVTPPGSRSKRKWAPANAIPPLSLPPLAKTPKKAVPPGWMRYGPAPALRRCDECGDDVVGVNRADICRGKRGCQALVCDACYLQSRQGQLRAIAPRLRDALTTTRGRDVFIEAGLVDEEWSSGRVCEPCLARLEARLDEFEDTPCPTPRAE